MEIRKVDENFAVAPQVQPEDKAVADATRRHAATFDDEETSQPEVDAVRKAAEAAGLVFHFIPVWGGQFPDEAVAAFRKVREEADGPVLAYCRTGTRCITLDTLANPDNLTADERIERAAAAGYDLSALRPAL
ncbi:MAG: TIGR01244 family sulfur transferase [Sphingomonadaceae bacterium]